MPLFQQASVAGCGRVVTARTHSKAEAARADLQKELEPGWGSRRSDTGKRSVSFAEGHRKTT